MLLASAIAASLSAAAYDFESAGIYYNITGDNTVEVTYSDRDNNTYSGSVSVPETVTNNGTEYSVTKIGEYAFQGSAVISVSMPECITSIEYDAFSECQNLESVTLPESLTTLGIRAFGGCQSLKAIKIPSGVTAIPGYCFNGCVSLESVTIPEGVTAIGHNAFQSCNLNALTLPESLEKIGDCAFYNNGALKSVNIPAKVKTIEPQAFYNCGLTELVIQEGVQTIGYNTFGNNSLKNLTLPSTIKSIGESAFSYNNLQSIICNAVTPPTLDGNAFNSGSITPSIKVPMASIAAYRKAYGWKDFSNYYVGEVVADGITYRIDENGATITAAEATLAEANIPSAVEFEGNQYPVIKINSSVFSGNTNLTAVTLPAGLVEIGAYAFNGCQNLASVTLPESLTTLGYSAFKACKLLKTIKIPSGVTAIPDQCFDGCSSLENVTIPEGVTTIGDYAFGYCKLNALTLPESLEKIGGYAFTGNKSLKSVNIPAKVKTIETQAFNSCGLTELVIQEGVQAIGYNTFGSNSLRNLTLPSTIKSIGNYAFLYNNNLQSITCNAVTPPTLGDDAFYESTIQDVKVPLASIAAYRKAYGWKDFSNYYGGEEIIDGVAYRIDDKGAYAFRHCSNITRVTLPDGLTTLGEGAFQQCEALVTADLMNPMEITSIPRYAFDGCSGLRNVYLPFFIEAVGDYAFRGCASLRQIQFVAPTKTIGAYAFSGCRSLKSLDLFKCENFTTIGSYAFSGCTSLKSLNLPKSLETIGEYAFSGCQAISVICSPSLVPPTIASESALNGIDKDVCVLTMPKSVYLDYFRAPYWGQFVEYTASVLVGVDGQGSVMYSNNLGTAPTPVKVAAFYATAGEGEGVEEDEGDGITAEAYDSANICAKDNSTLTFRIVPDEGNEIKSVTYAGEDVTAQVVDGLFTTPVINGDTNLDVSFVASTDYIAIPASAVSKGAEVVVPVELVNTAEVMGIECKVQIPEGFSVAKKADGSLKVEQTERKADQTLTAAVDGNVLTVKTSGTQAYTGNTGAVFTIAIAPDEATAPADYVLKVTDVKFVNATGVASRPDAKAILTLRDYVLGDVDSDQLVAINDAVIVMNHIVGADTPAFNAKAADMDGNGSVEINDAVLIMNTVVGTESMKSIKKTSATEPNADELTAAGIEICQGGTAMLSLDLANLDALTAAQFEIMLPEGITAGKAEAGERASRHMIKTNMVGNVLKVAMLSAESVDFEGSEGAILVLPLSADKTMPSGSYGISLRNVKMSDVRGNLFILPDADSSVVVKDWSGVDSVAFDRLRVYGGNGEICIESPADTVIQIVAVDGRAFAVEASAGKTAVAVSAGVYVVNGQKVIVK